MSQGFKWNPDDFKKGSGGHNTGDYIQDGICYLTAALLNVSGTVSQTSPIRSFGRLKVANTSVVFDSKQVYDGEPVAFLSHSVNVDSYVTHVLARSSSEISAGTGSAGRALRQTRRYFNYEPGRGQLIYITYNFSGSVTDVDKCAGYYDDDDGIYCKLSGSGPHVALRKSGSATREIPQADWNNDKLDGTGHSGLTLDFTKAQLMFIEFEYLGVGDVYIGWRINGLDCIAHVFHNGNSLDQPYMQTPNLPIRWEMINLAAVGTPATMDSLCCSVMSEGGTSHAGFGRGWGVIPGTTNAGAGDIQQIIGFRLNDTHRRSTIFPTSVAIMSDTSSNFRWFVSLNPTQEAGSAAEWLDIKDSYLQYDVASDGEILSGANEGIVMASGLSSNDINISFGELKSFLTLGSNYDGSASDILSICVQNTTQQTETYYATFNWVEIP